MEEREREAQLWLAVSEAVSTYLDQNRDEITAWAGMCIEGVDVGILRYAEDIGRDVTEIAQQHMEEWATAEEEGA